MQELSGADDGNRTRDLRTTNAVHYRLCYISTRNIISQINKKSKSICFFCFF